jgi:hypothetical protein
VQQADVPINSKVRLGANLDNIEDDDSSMIVLAWLRLTSSEKDDSSCLTVRQVSVYTML